MNQVTVTIAGERHTLKREAIERKMASELPEPLDEHFVVVAGKRFPPKQVITVATGLDRAAFNTHHARNVLSRLGFVAGRRRDESPRRRRSTAPRGGEADALRPFVGKWVAQRGLDV